MKVPVALLVGVAGCCAAVAVPGSREFLAATTTDFVAEKPLNQIGAISALIGLLAIAYQFAQSRARKYRDHLVEALALAEAQQIELQKQIGGLSTRIEELKAEAPSQFLPKARLMRTSLSKRQEVIEILQRGLRASTELVAEASCMLAIEFEARGNSDDFEAMEEAARVAEALLPGQPKLVPVRASIVERRAALAMAAGTYSPTDPQFAPVLDDEIANSEEAEGLAMKLCEQSGAAFLEGDKFLASRLAQKAILVANICPTSTVRFNAQYCHAIVLADFDLIEDAIDVVYSYVYKEQEALGVDSEFVFGTKFFLSDLLSMADRHEEALQSIDGFTEVQKTTLGPDHFFTLVTENLRARVLFDLDRKHEALKAIQELQPRLVNALGEDHPSVLVAGALETLALWQIGDPAGDEAAARHALAKLENRLGLYHPQSGRSRERLERCQVPQRRS